MRRRAGLQAKEKKSKRKAILFPYSFLLRHIFLFVLVFYFGPEKRKKEKEKRHSVQIPGPHSVSVSFSIGPGMTLCACAFLPKVCVCHTDFHNPARSISLAGAVIGKV